MSLLLLFNPNRSGGELQQRLREGWGMIELGRMDADWAHTLPLLLVDPIDGVTPVTGEGGGAPQVSKDGGPWTNAVNTLTEIGQGSYQLLIDAAELSGALRLLGVRYKSAHTAEFVLWAMIR